MHWNLEYKNFKLKCGPINLRTWLQIYHSVTGCKTPTSRIEKILSGRRAASKGPNVYAKPIHIGDKV